MPTTLRLDPLDAVVLAGYVVALACIGWWAARHTKKTTDDYFLAGRSIPWLVTFASFTATCISALTFIGTPAEGFSDDYRYLLSNAGDILATLFIASVFLPHFQKLKLTSIYRAVGERFGGSTQTLCSAYFLLTRTLASTVRIVAIAKVLEVVGGGALSYHACVVVTVLCVLSYTTMGGGRAIAWTDLLQFSLLMGGALLSLGYIILHVPGGAAGILEAGRHAVKPDGTVYDKFNFLELLKPGNLGLLAMMTVWGFFNSSATYGTDQDMMQRLLACNDNRKARWSLMLWGLASIPITFLFLSVGAGLYAYSLSHPALVAGMTDPDHVFPRFILTVMPPGLKGLLLAAVASAAMGSADSALASLSTSFTLDLYKPFWGRGASQEHFVKVSKLSFVGFGALFMLFGLLLHGLDNLLWLAFRIIAFTYGPLFGAFSAAILTDWKLSPRKMQALMLAFTVGTFTVAMTAWHLSVPAGSGFWDRMHASYWQWDVIVGAVGVFCGAWLLKEPAGVPALAGAGM